MNDLIHVPAFARLDDYVGLWAISPEHAAGIWQASRLLDFKAHMAEPPKPLAAVEMLQAANGKSVAVVKLTGMLMKGQSSMGGTSTIQARRDIRQAAANPDVSAILLAVDSPGGTVAGTSDLADEVKAAGKSKPVWAHVEDLCASAAYFVASQASRITVNSRTALIGSIGTMQVVRDYSGMDAKNGIRTLLFATGPLKGLGTPGVPVTEDQAAHMQQLIDAAQVPFDQAVKNGRHLTQKELEAVRTGGVFIAQDAMDKKLVDAIQPLSKTLAELSRGGDGRRAEAAPTEPFVSLPTIPRRGLPMMGI